jgi:hypothetical protein
MNNKIRSCSRIASVFVIFLLLLIIPACALFNQSPIASFTVTPSSGESSLKVTADASDSYDSDGTIVEYRWDFGAPYGKIATLGPLAQYTYTTPGAYTISLTVVDSNGAKAATTTQTVVVDEPPPFVVGDYAVWSYDTKERRVGTVIAVNDTSALVQFFPNAHEITAPESWIPYDSLSVVHSWQKDWIQSVIPHYYQIFHGIRDTLAELEDFLHGRFQQVRTHLPNYYDCSNMSAYLEWALENEGFDTRIIYGPTMSYHPDFDAHCWVLVNLPGSDCWAAVEATDPAFQPQWAPGIIYGDDDNTYRYYNGYWEAYFDIYSALACTRQNWGDEYSWWNITNLSHEAEFFFEIHIQKLEAPPFTH